MELEVIELFLDEEGGYEGVNAISLVENPAIEEDFIFLSANEVKLAKVSDERRVVMGAALIPDKKIFRKATDTKPDHYIVFGKDTVRQSAEHFIKNGNQGNATLEHQISLQGVSVVESWIVEDSDKDKSAVYGFNMPEGTWMVSMKIHDDFLWNEYVKTGTVKGLSIEGKYTNKRPDVSYFSKEENEALEALRQIERLIEQK